MKKTNTLTLAQLGIFSGIIILLTFTPLGFIPLGAVSATTIHIPVIIGAIVLGPKLGTVLGAVMGVFSLIRAVAAPASPLDYLFWNPIISVLPRIFIGLIAALVFIGIRKLIKNKASTAIAAGIAAAAGTLTNTVLVLGALVLIYPQQMGVARSDVLTVIFSSIVAVNGVIEIVSAIVLSIPIAMALLRMKARMKAYQ